MRDRAGRPAITAEQLLEQAGAVVRHRRRTYGQPHDLFERVAVRWPQVLGITVTPREVIVCLIDLKVARLAQTRGTWTASPISRAMPQSWRSWHPMRDLRSHLGRQQPEPIDAEATKRAGWREHGILVIAEGDPRLTWSERQRVRQLGTKLHGQRSESDR